MNVACTPLPKDRMRVKPHSSLHSALSIYPPHHLFQEWPLSSSIKHFKINPGTAWYLDVCVCVYCLYVHAWEHVSVHVQWWVACIYECLWVGVRLNYLWGQSAPVGEMQRNTYIIIYSQHVYLRLKHPSPGGNLSFQTVNLDTVKHILITYPQSITWRM